jgi:hypothetical protein
MIGVLYFLCFAVSTLCAFLLMRSWLRTRVRLLLWTGIGFTGIALNNLLLVVDNSIDADLATWRGVPTLAGLLLLIWGLTGERS